MKKVIILFFLINGIFIYSQATLSVGLIDDNLIDVYGLPLDTLFGGADDRYTFSFFVNYNDTSWNTLFNYKAVTLREIDLRYDSLSLVYNRSNSINNFSYSFGAGFEIIGNYGSFFFQNNLHRLFDFPEVDLQYLSNELGLIVMAIAKYNYLHLMDDKLLMNVQLQLKLVQSLTPSVLTFGFPICFKEGNFSAEIYPGGNIKYSSRNELLSGNSIFYRTIFSYKFENLIVNIGFSKNFFYFNPFNDSFTQYNKFTTGFNEDLTILEMPEFYIVLGIGSDSMKLKDLPLP